MEGVSGNATRSKGSKGGYAGGPSDLPMRENLPPNRWTGLVSLAPRVMRLETARPGPVDHEGKRKQILRYHSAALTNIASLKFFPDESPSRHSLSRPDIRIHICFESIVPREYATYCFLKERL